MYTNKDIFEAFHNTLLESGKDNNTFHLFNEDKTALIIYTESDPSNINRLLIEREGGDRFININNVKQAREEIDDLSRYFDNDYCSDNKDSMFKCNEVLAILDKLIVESEDK